MRRTHLAIAVLALLAVLVVAGCGGGGSSSSSASSSPGGGEAETASANTSEGEGGGYGSKSGGAGAAESESSETAAETSGKGEAESPAGGAAGPGTGAAVVKVTNTPDLGKVIVDAEGMTLYDFHKDKGTTSACYGGCAQAWPPLLTEGKPKAAGGAEASLLGVTKRKDGTEQVTYNGHPLYGFVGDKKPGDTTGNDIDDFGAEWYALEPNGEEPEDS